MWEAFLKSEDYAGSVEYCKREVSGDPDNLHTRERLGEAYNLDGRLVIEQGPYPGCECVRVRRKRDGGSSVVHE